MAFFLHAFRGLRRSPASSAAAVLTLTLTVGAGTAIFAVVKAVLFTAPPFAAPDTLVVAGETPIDTPAAVSRPVSYATFETWRDRAASLATLEAFDSTNLTLTGSGPAERISATDVTPGFMALLGVTPAAGRLFDARDAAQPVVIVSDPFWRSTLGAKPDAIGRTLMLNGRPHTVVGVLPATVRFAINPTDLWRPIPMTAESAAQANYGVRVVGRTAPGATATQLRQVLNAVSRAASPPAAASVIDLRSATIGAGRGTARLLGAAAVVALLLAVVNLAGLLLVRAIERRRELTVRTALGARRVEIAWQLLLDAAVIVTIGTGTGVLLAAWATPALAALVAAQFPTIAGSDIAIDWRALLAVGIAAAACTCICGLLPLAGVTQRGARDVLRRGVTASPRELTMRRVLVAGEIALAFVLLISLAAFGQSLIAVLRADPGFDARGVLTAQLSLPSARYRPEQVASFYSTLQDALAARLGAGTTAVIDELPLTGDSGRIVARADATDAAHDVVLRTASAGYFDVMGVPILAGRTFTSQDRAGAPDRVVVSGAFARALFEDLPVGRTILLGRRQRPVEIVGVVGDVKHRSLDEADVPTVYVSQLQQPSATSILVVRADGQDADTLATIRQEVALADRELPVYGVRTMADVVSTSFGMASRRLLTMAFGAFALLALVLSAVGLFGVAAHDAAARRPELALRLALGANPRQVLRTAMARGALVVAAGLAIGGVMAASLARASGGWLGSAPSPVSVGIAATVLVGAAFVAVLPAAWRASRTDPALALRGE